MNDQDDWRTWPAPAKLNLFLHVTGRLPNGYHALETVFRILDWGDAVHLRVREDGDIQRHGDAPAGVAAEADLSIRAARLLQARTGCPLGADIRVEKRIPAGGGLGGGSSDAASVLVALNAMWGLQRPVATLAEWGLALGADVPVFVQGRHAFATGVGEVLTPIELPPKWYLLAHPGVHASTAQLFSDPRLTRDSGHVKISDFAEGRVVGNAFEPVLRQREKAVDALFRALAPAGTPRLTGSGSTVFIESDSREAAEAAQACVPAGCATWVVKGADRSPLLDAVEQYNLGASPSG